MIVGDKATRNKSIPFEALPMENGSAITALNAGNFYLAPAFTTQSPIFPIVLSRPYAGDLTELRLTLRLYAASASGFSFKLAIGKLSSTYYWDADITQVDIDRMHQQITGKSTSFSAGAGGNVFLDDIDLLRGVYERGESGFNADAVCLLLCFDSIPAVTSGWRMQEFRVHGSSQQGLL